MNPFLVGVLIVLAMFGYLLIGIVIAAIGLKHNWISRWDVVPTTSLWPIWLVGVIGYYIVHYSVKAIFKPIFKLLLGKEKYDDLYH